MHQRAKECTSHYSHSNSEGAQGHCFLRLHRSQPGERALGMNMSTVIGYSVSFSCFWCPLLPLLLPLSVACGLGKGLVQRLHI